MRREAMSLATEALITTSGLVESYKRVIETASGLGCILYGIVNNDNDDEDDDDNDDDNNDNDNDVDGGSDDDDDDDDDVDGNPHCRLDFTTALDTPTEIPRKLSSPGNPRNSPARRMPGKTRPSFLPSFPT
ncbi:hypothetical protein ALC53_00785 [Atta colombica]|uniref:Uncharacterized protein n=1 Tax=Atta colombica TaxID=520822 RepID=A0A195BVN4_9HYME|nr:hypothetical protein ALC53_00785 [Atta colombica]